MNWVKAFGVLGVFFLLPAFADTPSNCGQAHSPSFEVKAGYLVFASQKMRDVYSNGGFEVQVSSSCALKGPLEIYGSIGFSESWGESESLHQKTSFWRIPVDLGLKPVVDISPSIQWYAALGPRYFYAHQHNESAFVNQNIGKSGIGAFVNTGFNFFPTTNFLIDVFAEYSYEPIHFSSSKSGVHARSVQVGGFYFGAGFGYAF